ncbi:MAG TPA: biotin/lipoyl-containing protein, partial [Allosphingosinicella sp.]|nr:biotin/lipoyl-containing protein [Allosphingosinicella sp.]
MARYEFKLPDIGEGIAEAEIVAWHVKVGESVAEDQQLADMMTDKATVEMESPVAGKVLEVAGEVGDMIPIGSVLVVIETEGGVPAEAETEEPIADGMAEVPEALDEIVPTTDVAPDERRATPERRSGEDRREEDRGEPDRRQGEWRAEPPLPLAGGDQRGGHAASGSGPPPAPPASGRGVQASPAVRQRARDLGIDL